MYLSVFLSLYSRKGGGRTPCTGHTFCIHSVRCLNYKSGGIWVYLSVFLSLYSRKGGGETPCTGPQPSAQYRKLASSLLHRLTPPRACAKCTEIHTYASIEVTFSGRALYPKKMKNRCFYLVGCDHYNHSMFHCWVCLFLVQLEAPSRMKAQLPAVSEQLRPSVGVAVALRKEDQVCELAVDILRGKIN